MQIQAERRNVHALELKSLSLVLSSNKMLPFEKRRKRVLSDDEPGFRAVEPEDNQNCGLRYTLLLNEPFLLYR